MAADAADQRNSDLEDISMLQNTLPAIALGGLLLVAAADQLPTLDIGPACAGASDGSSLTASVDQCKKSEQEARNTLASEWSKFHATDRRECLALTKIGGFPSYVQVLTCLEVARYARESP
jgi:hypothetical protein